MSHTMLSPRQAPHKSLTEVSDPARECRDVESFKRAFIAHLNYTIAKDGYTATPRDYYHALVHTIQDHLVSRWIKTQRRYFRDDPKRVYYISLEFLMGRSLGNSLINTGLDEICETGLKQLNIELNHLREMEWDAGLGNGGLGRLAACFLDSMATLAIPGYGYGIRYEYGIFYQRIEDGFQVEHPDNWLRYGNPWEFPRAEYLFPVKLYGRTEEYRNEKGRLCYRWVDYTEVMAMAYDNPVPGYRNDVVNTLRLWSAKSSRGFDLSYFNHGDYIKAVEDKNRTENISRVLYPNDSLFQGKELRLKQEYFLISATLQDILRRHRRVHHTFENLPDKVAIQLNDTHPALAIPELMRILIDEEKFEWDQAWEITQKVFAYTNHTILPEALERWPTALMRHVLPRHLQIIFDINQQFLETVKSIYPHDDAKIQRLSLIEENHDQSCRMANLAILGSHKVNGVSELHSTILKKEVFQDFWELYPTRFTNKTNGITPRRWLLKANKRLAHLITEHIGDKWITNLEELQNLIPLANDPQFRKYWQEVKHANKHALARYVKVSQGIEINPHTLFDVQVKRIHEYKRQVLNIFHAVALYQRIKANPLGHHTPRTIIIGGKAAPGYFLAKLIIKLAGAVSQIINFDPDVRGLLQVVFLENYRVSLAEKVIPAADLSEQISTAGTEASGTGNMKFALNGALTIGTLDGANIEIKDAVGDDNIFIFGLKADEVNRLKSEGYNPWSYYNQCSELRHVIDAIQNGHFSRGQPELFRPITDSLLQGGDQYCVLADFSSYVQCQESVAKAYEQKTEWTKKAIYNVAHMGRFSSDRTIAEYAKEIWEVL